MSLLRAVLRKPIALALSALAVIIAPFAIAAQSNSRPDVLQVAPVQTVGMTVLLRLQREGAPVYDFRKNGQTIPGVTRVTPKNIEEIAAPQVVLLGEEREMNAIAARLRKLPHQPQIFIVPSRKTAPYPDLRGVRQIAPRDLQKMLRAGRARVYDFAEAEEFAWSHIPGSSRVRWNKFISGDRGFLKTAPQPTAKAVVLICPVGSRSQLACRKLVQEGVPVLNLRGGMIAWQKDGLPVRGLRDRRSAHAD